MRDWPKWGRMQRIWLLFGFPVVASAWVEQLAYRLLHYLLRDKKRKKNDVRNYLYKIAFCFNFHPFSAALVYHSDSFHGVYVLSKSYDNLYRHPAPRANRNATSKKRKERFRPFLKLFLTPKILTFSYHVKISFDFAISYTLCFCFFFLSFS